MAVEKCFIQTGLPLALNNENRILKNKAADALKKIGPAAIPAYIEILGGKKTAESIRYSAVDALGGFGPAAKEAVPVLVDSLKEQNFRIRSKAAVALGRIGRDAKDAITALKEVLQDENKVVQKNAEWALSEIE